MRQRLPPNLIGVRGANLGKDFSGRRIGYWDQLTPTGLELVTDPEVELLVCADQLLGEVGIHRGDHEPSDFAIFWSRVG